MAIDPKNLAGTATLTFSDEFNTLDLMNGTQGTWDSNYWWGKPNGVTLTNNGEQQWYIDHTYAPTQSIKPWSVQDGVLSITAQNTSASMQSHTDGYQYTSGMLTTYESFSQQHGYFEVSAKLPEGQGLWPAFWLLPKDGGWPPEIDVMEHLGHDMNTYYTAAHTQSTGVHTSQGGVVQTPDLSASFHTYGVNWQLDNLTYYFDGQEVWKTPTPSDMDGPMYMLVNLAVGGYWPGNPNPDPNFSETMQVDYVRAYTAKPDGEVIPATDAGSDMTTAASSMVSAAAAAPMAQAADATLAAATAPTTSAASSNVSTEAAALAPDVNADTSTVAVIDDAKMVQPAITPIDQAAAQTASAPEALAAPASLDAPALQQESAPSTSTAHAEPIAAAPAAPAVATPVSSPTPGTAQSVSAPSLSTSTESMFGTEKLAPNAFDFGSLPSSAKWGSGKQKSSIESDDFNGLKLGWSHGKGHDKQDNGKGVDLTHLLADDGLDLGSLLGSGVQNLHIHLHNHCDHWSM